MSSFHSAAYGSVFGPLVAVDRRRPLDAGRPDKSASAALKRLSVESAFAHLCATGTSRPLDHDMAACCVAGVWLLHDFLDESHTISQGIDTISGSFWHAIMHRREGDFGNAKYWFRRVGEHPAFAAIAERAGLNEYNPFAFVDDCQSAIRGDSDAGELCLDIQQAEWELLFDYCYREAVSTA